MGAAAFVGRVGGLAVALGVGVAVFSGAPSAWADGPADGSARGSAASTNSAGSSVAGPSTAASERSRRSPGRIATGLQQNSSTAATPRPAAARRSPAVAPAAAVAPTAQVAAAAEIPTVTPAPNTPDHSTDSPTGLAALALSRRQQTPLGGSITVNPDVEWDGGLLLGDLNATSTRSLPLTYTVLEHPSLGGKITWEPGTPTRPGRFSYLPAMSTLTNPAQTEAFSVLVTEVTAFDAFLKKIPIVGLLADPVLKTLHRLPVISTLLAPIIGDAQVVRFNESAASLAAGRPVAFTYLMPSFDGTPISVNYFPAANVASGAVSSAPTVLNGPDLGFPGNTDVFSAWDTSLVNIVPGINAMRTDASPYAGGYAGTGGYNVITWDPRGEWASGGKMQLDNPNFEGRDVSSIITWATSSGNVAHSQVATDLSGDPYVGMVGGSYGGGIQLAVAGTPDRRIDAIVPSIAWNTLNQSLYPNNIFKTAIGSELLMALVATGARINGQIYVGILTGALVGLLSSDSQALLTNAGSGILANNIVAPTMFLQGTPDILFELDAAMTNGSMITQSNPTVPVKTTWFCGGHGVCLLPSSLQEQQGRYNMDDTLQWLDQYVAGTGTPADSIPTFQWFDQTGQYHSSQLNPFDPAFNNPSLHYQGSGGALLLAPLVGGSGPSKASVPPESATLFSRAFSLASGSKARNALNTNVVVPVGADIAGAPTLSFSYRGLGTSRAVYAQLVDNATGLVVGNIVTPVPVTLDGREHTVSVPMGAIAYSVGSPSDSLTLQITSSAVPYANLTAWGFINIDNVGLDVPTVATG
jgi:ABC-2 type transport system ATP-binding protein